MSTPQKILEYAKAKKSFKTSDLVAHLGISRQTVFEHLSKLTRAGKLVKTGSTRNAQYRIKLPGEKPSLEPVLHLIKKLRGLEEDRVFEEVKNRLGLKSLLSKNVLSIANYAFSEMLNNAIDHSKSPSSEIEVKVHKGVFSFKIKDEGIGIFENARRYFKIENEYQAAEHVLKGKQTTFPERHSGQGIFFTSRIADRFVLHSHNLKVIVDNMKDDAYFSTAPHLKGTLVEFEIKQRSKKTLQTIFSEFSSEEGQLEFDKNRLRVRLRSDRELMSRSEARRMLGGLEDYKIIIFDLKGITGIGQAFADEVFRVYPLQHPDKKIDYENALPAVQFMIERTKKRG